MVHEAPRTMSMNRQTSTKDTKWCLLVLQVVGSIFT